MKAPNNLRYAEILANLRPLAEFYRAHKPEVKTLRLYANDYAAIANWPKKAARHGFLFHGKQPHYQEFLLLSDTDYGP